MCATVSGALPHSLHKIGLHLRDHLVVPLPIKKLSTDGLHLRDHLVVPLLIEKLSTDGPHLRDNLVVPLPIEKLSTSSTMVGPLRLPLASPVECIITFFSPFLTFLRAALESLDQLKNNL